MVSAFSRQGTVAPTNYNILEDTSGLDLAKLQVWTWKHTHNYYNWGGQTRVPGVLQYAIKLCFIVTNFLHRVPSQGQCNRLYYL